MGNIIKTLRSLLLTIKKNRPQTETDLTENLSNFYPDNGNLVFQHWFQETAVAVQDRAGIYYGLELYSYAGYSTGIWVVEL